MSADRLNSPATDAMLRRMLATSPQPKKAAKKKRVIKKKLWSRIRTWLILSLNHAL